MKHRNPFATHSSENKIFIRSFSSPDEGSYVPGEKTRDVARPAFTGTTLNIYFRIIILGVLILFMRLVYLQIFHSENLQAQAEENRIRIVDISSDRGIIYDRNEIPLVKNEPNFLIQFTPIDIPRDQKQFQLFLNATSRISDKPIAEIQNLVEDSDTFSSYPVIITDNIDGEKAVETRIAASQTPGLSLGIAVKRTYLNEGVKSLSHILGYLGRVNTEDISASNSDYRTTDYIGKTGIETQYETLLKGVKGKEHIEVDSTGKRIKRLAHSDPVAGNNIVLTIDMQIQKQLESSLQKILSQNRKTRAAAIAMDPRNGDIVALVSLPAFDNNAFSRGITEHKLNALLQNEDNPLFNRSIIGQYPSGSTIKPVMALSALEEGIVSRSTVIYSSGGIQVSRWFFPDWKFGGHGYTNVTKALAESVNTFFYYIGGGYEDFKGLGVEKIIYYSKLFGIGEKTNIDLPSEAPGLLPSKAWKEKNKGESWYIGDTYHLAIGQGDILVTPLQVAQWTSVIANGGTLYKPHIVRKITDPDTNRTVIIKKSSIRTNMFQDENIKIVQQGMRSAVTSGSAKKAAELSLEVAGKTGTAQWSTNKSHHAWFTSFAPYENPTIVLTVLIEEGGEGSDTAVDTSIDFYRWWAQYAYQN